MVDYQFLGLVAVVLAVVTGGSVLTVVVVTGLVGLVAVGYQAGLRRYRRRHVRRPASGAEAGPAAPPDAELNRWMAAVQRVLTSHD